MQATWWIKLIMKLFKPFISSKFWRYISYYPCSPFIFCRKLIYIESANELHKYMNPGQVRLPINLQPDKAQYFGVDLVAVMSFGPNVGQLMPVLVTTAIDCIARHGRTLKCHACELTQLGLTTVGIFRLSGNANRITELKEVFNKGNVPNLEEEPEVHNIAGSTLECICCMFTHI